MIFAFIPSEGSLAVYGDLNGLMVDEWYRLAEDGSAEFFNEQGLPLVPVFKHPWEIRWLLCDDLSLEPVEGGTDLAFKDVLRRTSDLDENPWFATLDVLRQHFGVQVNDSAGPDEP